MRRRFRQRRTGRIWVRLLLLLIAAVFAVVLVDARLRPQLHALAAAKACGLEEQALNQAVLTTLESGHYDQLVTVEQNSAGVVTAVRTDALGINLLKSRILSAAEGALGECTQIVRIPIGSLTGLDILAGCGPNLRIPVRMSGFAGAEIDSDFSSAGINQTIHRLILRVDANVCLSMAKTQETKTIHFEVCIAETVIVGTVPQVYANMGE